jgi:hypothetical protein
MDYSVMTVVAASATAGKLKLHAASAAAANVLFMTILSHVG